MSIKNKEYFHSDGRPYTKEEFIDKIKTDKKFAEKFGNLGKIYGYQWRNWNNEIDQIKNLINDLKTNPDSRRLIVNAWNPSQLQQMTLPPCHYGFQVWTRELNWHERVALLDNSSGPWDGIAEITTQLDKQKIPTRAISLMWNQRSCDFPLGIPMNIASYALLLILISKQVNMVPEELIGNFGDCHIYENQIEGIKEQLTRTPYELPTVKIANKNVMDISEYDIEDIMLEGYTSHPTIKMPLSN